MVYENNARSVAMLCVELAKFGLNIGLSDARPAVLIRAKGMPTLYVVIDVTGEFFEWGKPENRHPVEDVAGAASRLADESEGPAERWA